jgi:cardiolipin synthase
LHRKLCVVDGSVAFCGGINMLDDFYDPNHGVLTSPRFDFAVRVRGPLVAGFMHRAMALFWELRFAAAAQHRSLRCSDFSKDTWAGAACAFTALQAAARVVGEGHNRPKP